MIVGLSGYARSGKDEAAKVLVEEYGFTRIAFADKLRDFLYALDPIVDRKPVYRRGLLGRFRRPVAYATTRVQSVINMHGWDGYKESPYGPEIRGLLQRLGTEAGRQVMWDSIWIDAAFADTDPNGNYVITDVRFPNEAEAVRQRGGVLWRIERAGVGPVLNENGVAHASETSLDDYEDFVQYLNNDGSLEDFQEKVSRAGQRWLDRVG